MAKSHQEFTSKATDFRGQALTKFHGILLSMRYLFGELMIFKKEMLATIKNRKYP